MWETPQRPADCVLRNVYIRTRQVCGGGIPAGHCRFRERWNNLETPAEPQNVLKKYILVRNILLRNDSKDYRLV